ncbi:MAG: hypothetical protein ACI9GW_000690 [Halieaceae bacterium]
MEAQQGTDKLRKLLLIIGLIGLHIGCVELQAAELNARLKAFATLNDLPDTDVLLLDSDNPQLQTNLDLRMLFRHDIGGWEFVVDHSTTILNGAGLDSLRSSTLDQVPTEDNISALDLSWTLDDGERHQFFHRFDRLAVRYRADSWGVTLGREAVTWGSGKVFNPMDLFAPFAPTTIDRDYKAGVDLIVVDKLFSTGSDVQVLGVFRRDKTGEYDSEEGSYAAKWRTFLGATELELALGRHYRDSVVAVSFRLPVGGALAQADWVATQLDLEDEWRISAVANIDYSFSLNQKTAYIFAEYYRNGFGEDETPQSPEGLSVPLGARLARGEVFGITKNYLAMGGSFQWHALLTQSATVLWNLHDNSTLWQTSIAYEPGDNQRIEAGITASVGNRGDEYGAIEIGEGITTGGGERLFARWVYYW